MSLIVSRDFTYIMYQNSSFAYYVVQITPVSLLIMIFKFMDGISKEETLFSKMLQKWCQLMEIGKIDIQLS